MSNLRQVVRLYAGDAARAFMSTYIGGLYKDHKDDARWDVKRPTLSALFADYASRASGDVPRSTYRMEQELNLAVYAVDQVVDALVYSQGQEQAVAGIVHDLLRDYWPECQVDECQCSVDARMHFKAIHVQALVDDLSVSDSSGQGSPVPAGPSLRLVA